MSWPNVIGFLAGICTSAAVLPQIIKVWKTRKVDDVSPAMFAVLLLGVALWVVYGILRNDWPIIATNGLSLSLNAIMLFLMIRYKRA